MNERYARQVALPEIGPAGQQRLSDASILVVGAGGLGCPVLQYLAAAGVGRLHLVDGDVVELSNLHRQPLYGAGDIGHPKVLAARSAIQRINPDVRVELTGGWLTPDNVAGCVAATEIAIDGGDNRAVTYMLSDACAVAHKPLISASALGFEGYVGGFCGNGPSYRALMPEMPKRAANCNTSGVMGTVVATLGTLEAHFALQLILGLAPSPVGHLLRFDAARLRFSDFNFRNAPEPDGPQPRFIGGNDVSSSDFVVELRSEDEAGPEQCLPMAHRILPSHIEVVAETAPQDARVVLCCRSGLRAWWAGRHLQKMGKQNLALIAMAGERLQDVGSDEGRK